MTIAALLTAAAEVSDLLEPDQCLNLLLAAVFYDQVGRYESEWYKWFLRLACFYYAFLFINGASDQIGTFMAILLAALLVLIVDIIKRNVRQKRNNSRNP